MLGGSGATTDFGRVGIGDRFRRTGLDSSFTSMVGGHRRGGRGRAWGLGLRIASPRCVNDTNTHRRGDGTLNSRGAQATAIQGASNVRVGLVSRGPRAGVHGVIWWRSAMDVARLWR